MFRKKIVTIRQITSYYSCFCKRINTAKDTCNRGLLAPRTFRLLVSVVLLNVSRSGEREEKVALLKVKEGLKFAEGNQTCRTQKKLGKNLVFENYLNVTIYLG